jgi:Domain of unknown function (DUF4136)
MKYIFRTPIASLAILSCLGCAQVVTVDMTGTKKTDTPIPSHVTYAVLPTTGLEKDAAFSGYAQLVAQKLDERGYRKTEPRVANLGVYLGYGVGGGQPADSSASQSEQMKNAGGASQSEEMGRGRGYGTMTTSSAPGGAKVYTTQLMVVVIDLPKSRTSDSLVELWRGESTTKSNSADDLPKLAPILIDTVFQHFGETTSTQVRHTMTEDGDTKKQQSAK